MEPAYALNELQLMSEEDDVQGAGIFDPPGTQKNINGSAGVFADNVSLPGYHARELPFSLSEERDVTTGRRIRAVPNGAVANDSAAQIAFFERGLYPQPAPPYRLIAGEVPNAPTFNVVQNPEPISGLGLVNKQRRRRLSVKGLGEEAISSDKLWLWGLVAGTVIVYAAFNQPKRARR